MVQTLPAESDQTDWQARGIELEHDRRKCSGWQTTKVRHGQVRNRGNVGISIRARMEVDFDQADAWQRTRLNVVNPTRQSEESLVGASNIILDLLRRHAGIESCDYYHRNVDGWKQIHRHSQEATRTDYTNG